MGLRTKETLPSIYDREPQETKTLALLILFSKKTKRWLLEENAEGRSSHTGLSKTSLRIKGCVVFLTGASW